MNKRELNLNIAALSANNFHVIFTRVTIGWDVFLKGKKKIKK